MNDTWIENGASSDQQLAIGLLAISAYKSGKAILALYEADQGKQALIFIRSQFEMVARAEYFANHKSRAKDFLLLEPFERYKLAQGYDLKEALRKSIIDVARMRSNQIPICCSIKRRRRGVSRIRICYP